MKSDLLLFSIILLMILFIYIYLKYFIIKDNYKILLIIYIFIFSFIINILIILVINYILYNINILDLLINNKLYQWLLFYIFITILNEIIWFLIPTKLSYIFLKIFLIFFRIILFSHSVYILWFIWNEINYNDFYMNIYLFFFFILLNILLQLYLVWNITEIDFILPNSRFTKTYRIAITILIIIMLLLIYLKNKLIKLFWLISILFVLIYNILKYNIDIQFYHLIYLPLISLNLNIYYNIIFLFIYIIISIKLSSNIYYNIYIYNLNYIKLKWLWYKKKDFINYLFILYIIMLNLIIIYYYLGDFIILNINLYNFGVILDMITYFIINLIHLIIFILKYIWIIIKIILDLSFIIYYDLIIYNLKLYNII